MKKRRFTKRDLWMPNPEWFWSSVDKNGVLVQYMKSKCWVWTKYCSANGYGMVTPTLSVLNLENTGITHAEMIKRFAVLTAHRVSWELCISPIPEGILVLHHCDNRACVRPSHLFLGDDQANSDDKIKKERGFWVNGEKQHLAKLTEDAVRTIRQERKTNPPTPLEELAKRFGVSLVAVSYAATGRTWKHVTEPPVSATRRGFSHDEKGRFSS